MSLFDEVLAARGLVGEARDRFLKPDYTDQADPFLLPDMEAAVSRLAEAHSRQEKVVIYGDYDIDGLSATALLVDAFKSFGFRNVVPFIPNRFSEGYGLTIEAIERLISDGAELIITVDTGSLSHKEIARASELGVDVIVTDHHNVSEEMPPAVAVVNPKRPENKYPFNDFAAVGVAFKLVQALQTRLDGLPDGQEKWLLDLVALGTVCDIVALTGENRTNVYYGLKVMANTRRLGLKALMALAKVEPSKVDARALGFGLGPRMNASGRLETAQYSLDMLLAEDSQLALDRASKLEELNQIRRSDQDKIYKEAILQAENLLDDPVLVVSHPEWSHGIIGIVAAKLLEKYKKPTFVLQELGDESKGSARSYGDFSAADAIKSAESLITKGGGHKLAAGVSLPTKNIAEFRKALNEYYQAQGLFDQAKLLLPKADASVDGLAEINENLLADLSKMEPFGNANPEPVFKAENLLVANQRRMGSDAQHVKLELRDQAGTSMQFLAFNAPDSYFVEIGEYVAVWFQPVINEWQGRRSVEGRILHLE